YMLLGAIGVPVFAGYSAGAAALVGPTGGYLLGYLPLAVLTGWFADHYSDIFSLVVGMVLGTAILYALGTLWLAKQLQMSFREGLAAGVIPFIPGDAAKIVITVLLGPLLKNTLKKAGYMIR
ncbi:MAG: biotin transporter BioY, partial [Firmicutes bacterium]|nr:biotin transporter BioY [Bacillota bacterium]